MTSKWLWFGDERGYNATSSDAVPPVASCGLVMKEDITQPSVLYLTLKSRCGLVMKEDITQPSATKQPALASCGLVMKEDITQRKKRAYTDTAVVVW